MRSPGLQVAFWFTRGASGMGLEQSNACTSSCSPWHCPISLACEIHWHLKSWELRGRADPTCTHQIGHILLSGWYSGITWVSAIKNTFGGVLWTSSGRYLCLISILIRNPSINFLPSGNKLNTLVYWWNPSIFLQNCLYYKSFTIYLIQFSRQRGDVWVICHFELKIPWLPSS